MTRRELAAVGIEWSFDANDELHCHRVNERGDSSGPQPECCGAYERNCRAAVEFFEKLAARERELEEER